MHLDRSGSCESAFSGVTSSQILSARKRSRLRGRRSCSVARCDPRFTRDVDIAVMVESDERAEALVHALASQGMRIVSLVEQENVGRLAMARLATDDGLSIDLLIASSGIESEIVMSAETLEVVQGILLPVARIGHLIALKLLSVAPGRETDSADLRNLAAVADDEEWSLASEAVALIEERGFARGRQLDAELLILRKPFL